MSAIWRAVATWFAHVFLRRGHDWAEPWNAVTVRALSGDLHLPFETHSLAPTPPAPKQDAAPPEPAPHRAA